MADTHDVYHIYPPQDLEAPSEADRAICDEQGRDIIETYATKVDLESKADLVDGKVPIDELPEFTVIEQYATIADFPEEGDSEMLYVAKDTNKIYRWQDAYIELSKGYVMFDLPTDASVLTEEQIEMAMSDNCIIRQYDYYVGWICYRKVNEDSYGSNRHELQYASFSMNYPSFNSFSIKLLSISKADRSFETHDVTPAISSDIQSLFGI